MVHTCVRVDIIHCETSDPQDSNGSAFQMEKVPMLVCVHCECYLIQDPHRTSDGIVLTVLAETEHSHILPKWDSGIASTVHRSLWDLDSNNKGLAHLTIHGCKWNKHVVKMGVGTTGADGSGDNRFRWVWGQLVQMEVGQLVQMGTGTTSAGVSGDSWSRWVWGQLAGSQSPFSLYETHSSTNK